jgi:effector-binding domain-containing protein
VSYEVTLREVQAIEAMTKRIVTSMKSVSEDMKNAYGEVWAHIQKYDGVPTGECFALYHDEENFDPNKMDVEVGFSVKKLVSEENGVVGREVEGGLHASVMHKGPYSELESAYAALGQWIKANGYTPLAPARDIYLNDPSMAEPAELLTEVLWPVRK